MLYLCNHRGSLFPQSVSMSNAKSEKILNEDIIIYVCYTEDINNLREFLRFFLTKITLEFKDFDNFPNFNELCDRLPLIGLKALFFCIILYDENLRYYIMQDKPKGLQNVDPHKMSNFIVNLQENIIIWWISNEHLTAYELVHACKNLYINA